MTTPPAHASRQVEHYSNALIDQWARERPNPRCCGPHDQHAAQPDPYAYAATLMRLDVEPRRIPSFGLLEHDQTHDEWRIEVYTAPPAPGHSRIFTPGPTKIIRRHAGRRAPTTPCRRTP